MQKNQSTAVRTRGFLRRSRGFWHRTHNPSHTVRTAADRPHTIAFADLILKLAIVALTTIYGTTNLLSMSNKATTTGTSLGVILRRSRDALWSRMEHELRQAGEEINFSQYIVLKNVSQGEAQSTELARIAGINAGAMTRVIDSLVERDILQRKPHPTDRRVWLIDFTKNGQEMWSTIDHCGQNVLKAAFRNISKSEQEQFEKTLRLIIDNLHDIPEGTE